VVFHVHQKPLIRRPDQPAVVEIHRKER